MISGGDLFGKTFFGGEEKAQAKRARKITEIQVGEKRKGGKRIIRMAGNQPGKKKKSSYRDQHYELYHLRLRTEVLRK